MKKLLGLLLVVAGVILGVWAGIWWAFIGGIIQVVEQVRAVDMDATILAIGIAKIVFAGFIGTVSGICLIAPGAALFGSGVFRSKSRWK